MRERPPQEPFAGLKTHAQTFETKMWNLALRHARAINAVGSYLVFNGQILPVLSTDTETQVELDLENQI